jgi:hypothetical protein
MNYFVRTQDGAEFGPLTARQLRDAAKAGSLSRGDLVRPDGTVDWFRADKVRGLEFAERSLAPVAQPTGEVEPVPSFAPMNEPPPQKKKDDGLVRHIEPLALRGFNVRKLDGEEVESVEPQSFLDALRLSFLAAIFGKRGVLVLTNRRVFVTNATISTRALQSVYLDRIDRIGFGSRLAVWRLLFGLLLVLAGLSVWLAPALLGLATGAGFTLPPLEWQPAVPVGVGAIIAILARYRALEIGVASGTVMFAKRSLELDTLSRIDEARERRDSMTRRASAGTP